MTQSRLLQALPPEELQDDSEPGSQPGSVSQQRAEGEATPRAEGEPPSVPERKEGEAFFDASKPQDFQTAPLPTQLKILARLLSVFSSVIPGAMFKFDYDEKEKNIVSGEHYYRHTFGKKHQHPESSMIIFRILCMLDVQKKFKTIDTRREPTGEGSYKTFSIQKIDIKEPQRAFEVFREFAHSKIIDTNFCNPVAFKAIQKGLLKLLDLYSVRRDQDSRLQQKLDQVKGAKLG